MYRTIDEKGTKVNSTERSTKTPSPRTGLFATLRAVLPVKGCGARSRTSLGLCLAILALALSAASAAASPPTILAGGGSGAGQVTSPFGVAVDQSTGVVYVADAGNSRVDEFDSSGHFIMAFGWGVLDGAAEPQTCTVVCEAGISGNGPGQMVEPNSVAVDQASHDIYVSSAEGRRVQKFTPTGEFIVVFGKEVNKTKVAEPGSTAAEQDVCTAASGDTCGGGREGPGPGEFGNQSGDGLPVAVDSSGNVWVGDVNRIEEFNSSGVYQSQVSVLGELHSLAVDSFGDFYTVSSGVPGVHKLTPTGEPIYTIDESGNPEAVALDGFGRLFVGEEESAVGGNTRIYHFLVFDAATGAQTKAFGAREVIGGPRGNALAFGDAAEALYVVSSESLSAAQIFTLPAPGPIVQPGSASATEIHKTTATLNATVNPEGAATTTHFQYITEKQFMQDGETFGAGTLATAESASIGEDYGEDPASATVTGLKFETAYRFRVVATNPEGAATGEAGAFTTLPPLRVDSASSFDVTSTSATLDAQINPLGDAATYRFEYLPEAAYLANGGSFSGPQPAVSVPQPDGALGSGEADVEVSRHLQGLSPNTVYRYRVVAFDSVAVEGIASAALAFATQGSGGPLALPDGREWELASPPDKHGAGILPILVLAPGTQAAAAGGAIAYVTTSPTEGEPAGNSNVAQVLSTRGPDGWGSRDLAIPHSQATGVSNTVEEYRGLFSSDLSLGIAQPFGAFDPLLSGEGSEQTAYLRTDYLHGEPGDLCTASCYRPLVTGAPGFENVPPGTEFGSDPSGTAKCPPEPLCGPLVLGATPDLGHIALFSGVGLTSTPGDNGGLYEWSGGQLQPVSVLPSGKPAEPRQFPGPGQGAAGSSIVLKPTVVRHAVSEDGSRVYFTNEPRFATGNYFISGALYVREGIGTPQARTVAVPGGAFQTASADGSRAFVLGGGELSEFDLETEVSTPLAAGVLGVIGASEDGSSVYFVSSAVLTGEENGQGKKAEAGQPNLYVSRAGSTTFIATLSGEDSPDWGSGASDLPLMTARVSPDGGWLAFMSQRSLTGYDNHDAVSGAPDQEVYLYAAGAGSVGTLVCASCDPTGARPHGVEYSRLEFGTGTGLVGGESGTWNGSQWLAANVPGWTSPYHQSRYLSDSGRLFFNSSDALVPQDTNNTEDVYQYEPPGIGGCTRESPTFGRASGGCVGLISSGSSPEESAFLDASEGGADVFFLTAAKLSSLDVDAALDVYDAHECNASSPCPPPPPPPPPACEGDACQSPVAAPEDPTPGSLTYMGPGNPPSSTSIAPAVKPKSKPMKCRKGSVRKHGRCVKTKAGKRARARKAASKRRAKS